MTVARTVTIPLTLPVIVEGSDHRQLIMRRSKVRDRLLVDRLGGSDAEKEVRLFANLCEVAPEVIEDLDEADYEALQRAYLGFRKVHSKTSEPPA